MAAVPLACPGEVLVVFFFVTVYASFMTASSEKATRVAMVPAHQSFLAPTVGSSPGEVLSAKQCFGTENGLPVQRYSLLTAPCLRYRFFAGLVTLVVRDEDFNQRQVRLTEPMKRLKPQKKIKNSDLLG